MLRHYSMVSPQCSVDMNFETSWMIRLVSPLIVLVPLAGGIHWMVGESKLNYCRPSSHLGASVNGNVL